VRQPEPLPLGEVEAVEVERRAEGDGLVEASKLSSAEKRASRHSKVESIFPSCLMLAESWLKTVKSSIWRVPSRVPRQPPS